MIAIQGLRSIRTKHISIHKLITPCKAFCYKGLGHIDPIPELEKYYFGYLNSSDRGKLQRDFDEKYKSLSRLSSRVGLMQKFKGFMEYKKELADIQEIIRSNISNSDDYTLQDLSGYYFSLSGKMIRPYFLIKLSQYLYECSIHHGLMEKNNGSFLDSEIYSQRIKPFAACVEVIHNASLLQDDIIDNSPRRRNVSTAHLRYGIRNTVFSSNYLLSKAAALLSDLNIIELNEVYSDIVFALTYGEYQQTINKPFSFSAEIEGVSENMLKYLVKTYYKTASLLALSFRGLGVIFQLSQDLQIRLFNLGLHLGVVFQIVDDLLDVIEDDKTTKKPSMQDIEFGLVNAYIIYEMLGARKDELVDLLREIVGTGVDPAEKRAMIERVVGIIREGLGIIKTKNLALDHLLDSLRILDDRFFIENSLKSELTDSIIYMFNRNF